MRSKNFAMTSIRFLTISSDKLKIVTVLKYTHLAIVTLDLRTA